jgi:rubrerythrin
MLSKVPFELGKIGGKELNMEIMRTAIIAELDAINLYEQLAAQTDDAGLKKALLDVAGEEKTYVGEFQTMLLRIDEEQVRELEKGKEEVRQPTGK